MHLPGPLRAAVGLLGCAADEARHLPDRAIQLPMLAVSTALQVSLRAQQRYARLAARGDAILNRRAPTEDPPSWATFDDPVPIDELRRGRLADPDATADASRLLEDMFGVSDPSVNGVDARTPSGETLATKSGPKASAARKAAAKQSAASATTNAPVKKAQNGKTVSKPRHTAPSAFDNASDDD